MKLSIATSRSHSLAGPILYKRVCDSSYVIVSLLSNFQASNVIM